MFFQRPHRRQGRGRGIALKFNLSLLPAFVHLAQHRRLFYHLQMKKAVCIFLFLVVPVVIGTDNSAALDADAIVQAAVSYYRGNASVATVEMIVHRPNWQRAYTIRAWTRGQKDSLFTILAPPRDKGNGTLKRGREMWTYNPKVNRVIKLPPSMMSQSWMGSDFSNSDLAKSDSIHNDYEHSVVGTDRHEGKTVYLIE